MDRRAFYHLPHVSQFGTGVPPIYWELAELMLAHESGRRCIAPQPRVVRVFGIMDVPGSQGTHSLLLYRLPAENVVTPQVLHAASIDSVERYSVLQS